MLGVVPQRNRDPHQGRDTPAAGEQIKKSNKGLVVERNSYAQVHLPVVPITSPQELEGAGCEGWQKQRNLRLGRCLA